MSIFSQFLKNPSKTLAFQKKIDGATINIQDQNTTLIKKIFDLEQNLFEVKCSQLRLRKLVVNKTPQISKQKPELIENIDPNDVFASTLKKIESLCPQNFKKWEKLLYVNENTYVHEPIGSCSLDGHREAELFNCFMSGYLIGNVLDVGCGPHPIPYYLSDYPVENISGLDPLNPISSHPFQFVKGFCEHLPWKDESFNTVIVATSLDHVLVPDQCMKEVSRVLTQDGKFLVWVSFMNSDHEYNPFDPSLEPIDKFHLFHFNKTYFRKTIQPYFNIVEEISIDNESYFYALSKRSPG